LITRAPWSTALHDLRDHELRVEGEAGDPEAVRRVGCDLACDERPVTLRVSVRRAADERPSGDDTAHQVGMPSVDARVDHCDAHGKQLGRGLPERPRVVLVEIPLLRRERLGVVEGEGRRRQDERERRDCERERPSHGTAIDAETPAASPCPGAQRTR
jgi:hypothetical protein